MASGGGAGRAERRPKRAAPRAADEREAAAVRVRMYRQGFGDCFLLSLPRAGGAGRLFIMIDCGVLHGTAGAEARLRAVVADIAAETGGFVDVLAVTHEHYDHLSGFLLAEDLFVPAGGRRARGKLAIGELWMPWTENPRDPLARRLQAGREARLRGLAASVRRLHAMGLGAEPVAEGLGALLAFFGLDPDGGAGFGARGGDGPAARRSPTRVALDKARALVRTPRYWSPGDPPWTSEAVPGLRVFALGPPRDEAMLRKTSGAAELYHLAGEHGSDAALFGAAEWAAATAGAEWAAEPGCPFDPTYARPLRHSPLAAGEGGDPAGGLPEFLDRHYYGRSGDPLDPDQSWRRIDGDWLGAAAEFALALDEATNNTSLALAVELEEGGRVLLFAADAQLGNWLSWQDAAWTGPDGSRLTGTDLLRRAVFYKVGHHGSHNATPRARGLELMEAEGLVAFLPVDAAEARRRRWNRLPLPGLLDALRERCAGRLVRADESFAATAPDTDAVRAFQRGLTETDLYYEWEVPPPPPPSHAAARQRPVASTGRSKRGAR